MWETVLDQAEGRITAPLPLQDATARLATAAAALGADCVPVGRSRSGRPLDLVRIGSGTRRVLWYAAPHANEVGGVSAIVALAERLAAAPRALDSGIGVDLLLCVDPDAYVRNEPWFADEIEPAAYYRHFHRPAMDEWPDWNFPVDHRGLVRDASLPETTAMMAALEMSRPAAMVSLHNGELHGLHCYVCGTLPGLLDALATIPGRYGFPLEETGLEDPSAESLAPGMFPYPDMTPTWDALIDSGAPDPAALLPMGDSAAAWARRRFGTVTVLAEVPHWTLAGELPAAGTVGDLMRGTADGIAGYADRLRRALDAVDLPDTDLRTRACRDGVVVLQRFGAGYAALADSPAGSARATSADVARVSVMLGECLPQRYRGMLLGALVDADAPTAAIADAQADFDAGLARIAAVPVRAHPFADMVDALIAAGIAATTCLDGASS